jgi:flagellar motility protein MotE (MotC chaperone)
MSLLISSVSKEAAFFTLLSNACVICVVSMVVCSFLLRGFVGMQKRRLREKQQQQTNGNAMGDDVAKTSGRAARSSFSRDDVYLNGMPRPHQRKQQPQGFASSAMEREENEMERLARSKARDELASELESLKALQANVKSQLATLQGLLATKAKTSTTPTTPIRGTRWSKPANHKQQEEKIVRLPSQSKDK